MTSDTPEAFMNAIHSCQFRVARALQFGRVAIDRVKTGIGRTGSRRGI